MANIEFLNELEDEIADLIVDLQALPEHLSDNESETVETTIQKMETLTTNLRTIMQDQKKEGE